MIGQRRSERLDVSDVACEDWLRQSYRNRNKMRIDHVGRPRSGENAAHGCTVIEGMDDHCVEESGEA